MIPSSLLIKIFGVAVAGFLTIGVPVIVNKETARQAEIEATKKVRQAEIDKTENFKKFFNTQKHDDWIYPGETFSGKLFHKDWKPTDAEQKILFENWSTKIKHLPIEFFNPYLSTINTNTITKSPNTCYLRTNYFTNETRKLDRTKLQFIFTPFSKDKLTSLSQNQTKTVLRMDLDSNIQYLSYESLSSQPTKIESSDKEISFLDSLYETTSTHIKELSFTQDESGAVWAYDPKHCSTDVAASASK